MATKFVTVSIEIMHDKNLSPNQKFILAEIEQLSQLNKGCYASNQHFSDLIGINKSGVSKAIGKLEELGYISTEIKLGSRNRERIITLLGSSSGNRGSSSGNLGSSSGQEAKGNKTINIQEYIKSNKKINPEALQKWVDYKGSSYTKQGITLSANKLSIHTYKIQMDMVENSIMNGYKGLFEPSSPAYTSNKEPEVGSIAWRMKQKDNEIEGEVCDD